MCVQFTKQGMKKKRTILTSTIILQLLQGPICVKTCRMRGSVTSLDRFPTYLQTRGQTVFIKQEVACKQRLVRRASYDHKSWLAHNSICLHKGKNKNKKRNRTKHYCAIMYIFQSRLVHGHPLTVGVPCRLCVDVARLPASRFKPGLGLRVDS